MITWNGKRTSSGCPKRESLTLMKYRAFERPPYDSLLDPATSYKEQLLSYLQLLQKQQKLMPL